MTIEQLERFKAIVTVHSGSGSRCKFCSSGPSTFTTDLQTWVNHYLGHGLTLLHIGSESDGEHTSTVAVLGSDTPIPADIEETLEQFMAKKRPATAPPESPDE